MKFATLFLIASAVLALPTSEEANNSAQLAKKDDAPAEESWNPTTDENDNNNDNYRFRNDEMQVPETNKSQQNQNDKSQQNQNNKPQQNQNNKPQQNQNAKPQQNQNNKPQQNQNAKPQENQNAKPQENQNAKPQQEVSLKDKKDNNGTPCNSYFDKDIKEVPEECMKSVFCRTRIASKFGCGDISFSEDWTKEKLINEDVSAHCVDSAICKYDDYYTA